jgi:hypothetical protein
VIKQILTYHNIDVIILATTFSTSTYCGLGAGCCEPITLRRIIITNTIIRITRHDLDQPRQAFLRSIYGDDVNIITDDIPYGSDSVAAVKALIEKIEGRGYTVVALEAQAPFPVTLKLVDRRRDLGVALIRAQFERDEGGRAIVTGQDASGRDLLKFSHYEEVVRIEFETHRLCPPR